jgi:hypothetical protein
MEEVVMRIVRLTTIVALGLSLSGASAFAAQGNINRRQARQQARIYRSVKSGELTLRETERLEAQEARIAALEAKDRRTGGGLSPRERAQLERDLNSESHKIYVAKHNGNGK